MRDPAVLVKYKAWNGPMPTTAAQAAVSTGTAIITLLQIATPSTRRAMPNEATSECSGIGIATHLHDISASRRILGVGV